MESVIKGVHHLKGVVDKSAIEKMEQAAFAYWDKYGVAFRILNVTDKDITIRTTQENSPDGKYMDGKGLITITNLIFKIFFQSQKVKVQPITHLLNPVDVVTAEWIRDKMLKTGTKLKDLVAETGLNKSYLSTLTNGVDPLSDMAKAMFYYYFKSKEKKDES